MHGYCDYAVKIFCRPYFYAIYNSRYVNIRKMHKSLKTLVLKKGTSEAAQANRK